ncbi:MAG: thioesterase, partial [Luteibaculum sp.]
MGRIKIELPPKFQFGTEITVRVGDLNYGNHLGNDSLLALLHQARVEYIKFLGAQSELDFFGSSLIMAD